MLSWQTLCSRCRRWLRGTCLARQPGCPPPSWPPPQAPQQPHSSCPQHQRQQPQRQRGELQSQRGMRRSLPTRQLPPSGARLPEQPPAGATARATCKPALPAPLCACPGRRGQHRRAWHAAPLPGAAAERVFAPQRRGAPGSGVAGRWRSLTSSWEHTCLPTSQ